MTQVVLGYTGEAVASMCQVFEQEMQRTVGYVEGEIGDVLGQNRSEGRGS